MPHAVLATSNLSSRDKGAVIGAVAAVRANLAEGRSGSKNPQECTSAGTTKASEEGTTKASNIRVTVE